MKKSIKLRLRNLIHLFAKIFSKTRIGRLFTDVFVGESMNSVYDVNHGELQMKFAIPNEVTLFRAKTFSTKEPETLEWIDKIPDGSVLWDIGANVGLYSVYAAKSKSCRVYAFEPSVFNLEMLARNIFLNSLQDQIVILPLALCDNLGSNMMNMSMIEWGGACSTFGKDFGWDGQSINNNFNFQTFGITMDQALSLLGIPAPDFIKMDVDGIEHFILKEGNKTLDHVKSILVEINDDFVEQAEQTKILLEGAGLYLSEKRQGNLLKNSIYKNSFNQIWVKDNI